jgi:hypothetical protein
MSTMLFRRAAITLAAAAALALAPSMASAQSVIDQITTQTEQVMTYAGLRKNSQRDGNLNNNQYGEFTVQVPAGAQVVFAGICDQDCSDVDLKISMNGRSLGEDVLDDDAPIVVLQNFGGGQVTVRVEMPACSVDPCAFRVMVFGK